MDLFETFSSNLVVGFISFYNSSFFSLVKFIIGIYVSVVLVDIVLLLIQRGVSGNMRETLFGINIPKEMIKAKSKNRLKLQWQKIKSKLDGGKESDYEVAVVSASNLVDDLLKKMGYGGADMGERLENINPGQIENLEDLKRAYAVKSRILQEKEFKLNKEDAAEVLEVYEEFLRIFEILD